MRREEKDAIITSLAEKINETNHFYLTDISSLNAIDTGSLRRLCFQKEVKLVVVKNTLLKKAFEKSDKQVDDFNSLLKDSTSIMFSEQGNVPAKLIKEFRKKHNRPILKGAYVEESIYIGEEQLETLANLKSKEEIIGDIILLLQSPVSNVISSLKSGSNVLAGVVKKLSEKE